MEATAADMLKHSVTLVRGGVCEGGGGSPCPCQGPNYLQQELRGGEEITRVPLIFLFPESIQCDSSRFVV